MPDEPKPTAEDTNGGVRIDATVGPDIIQSRMRGRIKDLKRQLKEAKDATYKAELKLLHFRRAYGEWLKLLVEP